MTGSIQSSDVSAGRLSADGQLYWDGAEWKSAVSTDGAWRWNGAAWVTASQSQSSPRYASADTLALWLCILLGVTVAVQLAQLVFEPYLFLALTFGDLATGYNFDVAGLAMLAITSVVFLVWFHRSHRNLIALGASGLQFSAGWAVACWFIPIADLWMPYHAAREIWKGSDPLAPPLTSAESRRHVRPSALLPAWWAAWLVSLALANAAAISPAAGSGSALLLLASAAATAVSAVLAIKVVRSVGARQNERWRLLKGVSLPV
jgi:hypothetical protein